VLPAKVTHPENRQERAKNPHNVLLAKFSHLIEEHKKVVLHERHPNSTKFRTQENRNHGSVTLSTTSPSLHQMDEVLRYSGLGESNRTWAIKALQWSQGLNQVTCSSGFSILTSFEI
jgi:hypothetical protein